ncbi:MAG: polyprenol phosphomannose-dependent alpha 1,6 mannosyltransferase MptB, partial [Actinomycetota bacterium]
FNPYQVGVAKLEDWFKFGIDPMWAQTTTPYGAAYLLIEKFAAWISIDSTYTSMVFLRGVNIAAFVITIYGINRLAKIHNISQNFAMWLAVLNPITILHLVNAVHNDSLMIAAIVWGFVFAHEKRLVTASLTVAFAVAIKPIALIALPFLAISKNPQFNLQQRIKDWASTAIVSLSALAALGYATGTGFGWVNAISTPGTVLNLAAPISLISEILDKSLSWFGHDLGETIFPLIRFTGLVFCGLYVAKKSLDKSNESGTRRAGLALACMILLSPVVFPWYFLWPLALFAASGLRTSGALKISVYGTLLVVAYSIIEAVAVRDSAITPQDLLFSAFVFAAVFSLMRFKENKEIFEMEQANVS